MSALRLTPEQEKAARRGAGDACVAAGAGSGKTTVLTARYVTLCDRDALDPRRVAALTFTDAAAIEMRDRIAKAFSDPSASRRLRLHARDVEFAPISTIHSFCARLLRENAIEAGVDPAFGLLDESRADLALAQAFDVVTARWRRAGDPRLAVLRRLAGNPTVEDLFLGALPRVRGAGQEPRALVWRRVTTGEEARGVLSRALSDVDRLVAKAGPMEEELAETYREARERLPGPEAFAVATPESVRKAREFADMGLTTLLPFPKGATWKAARDALHEAYGRVAGALVDEIAERDVARPLVELWAAVDEEHRRAKEQAGVLDFTDLEEKALALLDALAAGGKALEGAPHRLLVDEFQDVNPVQARILARLRRPAGGIAPVDLFAVGDEKQAIYGFRGADVGVIRGEWEKAGEAGRERLSESFRSREELVEFHNEFFPARFAEVGLHCEPMTARGRFHDHAPIPPELLVVVADPDGAEDRTTLEARAVAAKVRQWVEGGALRTKKEKDDRGNEVETPRPLAWGDVAILLRRRTNFPAYERALLEAGVPFHVERGRGFFGAEEIVDLAHLLRVVFDPLDRFAVAAWIASPAVGGTDEDLVAVFGRGDPPLEIAATRPALAPAVATVLRLRRVAATSSLEDTVCEAIAASDAVAVASLQSGGRRRAANLRKAVSLARSLDAEGGHGLVDLLKWIEDLATREAEEGEASAGEERQSVALTTIHGAKGLEWPCVVLGDANASPTRNADRLLLGRDGSFAWRLTDPLEGGETAGLGHEALAAEEAERAKAEAVRLLYVGLTRAEERLVVAFSATGRNKDGTPARLLGWAKDLWTAADPPTAAGCHEAHVGDSPVTVTVLAPDDLPAPDAGDRRSWMARYGPEGILSGPAPGGDPAAIRVADAHWARARTKVETLGRTPFVVTISDLLAFAESPRRWYEERYVLAGAARSLALHAQPDDPGSAAEASPEAADLAEAKEDRLDEGRETLDGIDRAALGRAVHAAVERWRPSDSDARALVARAVEAEFGKSPPAGALPLARAMVERFAASDTAREVRDALAKGRVVGREVAFHARIAFPGKAEVAGFSALLVKGTMDLWFEGERGPLLVDHKTNSPRGRLRTVDAIRDHYAPQLRLYALAAERVLGRDVEAARLLLLDPRWEGLHPAPEVDVDVSGDRLKDARRLCQAFAVASFEDRWPERWEALLA